MIGIQLAERGLVPDPLIRIGIRRLLRSRLRDSLAASPGEQAERNRALRQSLAGGPIAVATDLANEQHYEVPAPYFERVLGGRLKYSCCLFESQTLPDDLDRAELRMLERSVSRAGIEDGMRILDLGCGWGSMSLHLARRFPRAQVLAVSNSKLQREFILSRCQRDGIDNVEVVTADVNHFDPEGRFDRIVSIEMFEHIRNQALLLARIRGWLEPDGALFVHHFAHRSAAYPYEADGDDDWMARTFFTGGIMPSDDHLLHLQDDLEVAGKWVVDGTHYQKTAEAWLARHDAARDEVLDIFADAYGRDDASRWFERWRLFYLACAELFGYRDGQEWWVVHARMQPRAGR